MTDSLSSPTNQGMEQRIQQPILEATGADEIQSVEVIQPLWNHYGTLSRVRLRGGAYPSVIVKHIQIPEHSDHPRGWGGSSRGIEKSGPTKWRLTGIRK